MRKPNVGCCTENAIKVCIGFIFDHQFALCPFDHYIGKYLGVAPKMMYVSKTQFVNFKFGIAVFVSKCFKFLYPIVGK